MRHCARIFATTAVGFMLSAPQALGDDAATCATSNDALIAIATCTRAIASGGDEGRKLSSLYNQRGIAYAKRGYLEGAIADYTEAIRLDPKHATAYYNRGKAWRAKGNYDRAIADYTEAIKITPNDTDAWNNRCFARAIWGRELQLALADCNEALRLAPNHPGDLDTRGVTYLKLGQYDMAIADYDAVLKIVPNIPDSLYGRGMAKRRKGDATGGDADIAAAKAIRADIADVFAGYGVK